MWKSTVGGRTLHFHLAGINNQNFIMRDEETGTWWQQVSGQAIQGPLAGRSLDPIHWDEVTFAVWKSEHPETTVLLGVAAHKDDYATADWEKEIAGYPTPSPADPADLLQPRDLIVGIAAGGEAKAFPWSDLETMKLIADEVGETPVVLLMHSDKKSVRCFDRRTGDTTLDLHFEAGVAVAGLADGACGRWDFSGLPGAGSKTQEPLRPIECLKDFWFDWKAYNPATHVFHSEPPPAASTAL